MDSIEALLRQPPFAAGPEEKTALLVPAVQAALQRHYEHCAAFRTVCDTRRFAPARGVSDLAAIPYLPAQFFKQMALSTNDGGGPTVTLRSSATTSGVPSQIVVDAVTARRHKLAVVSVLKSYLGPERLPFVVFDADPSLQGLAPSSLTARGAAIRGFLLAANAVDYVMVEEGEGGLRLDTERLGRTLAQFGDGERMCLFGFTAPLYQAMRQVLEGSMRYWLPQATVLHIGGWKKLQQQAVTKSAFAALMGETVGVPPDRVIDVYGFTEQIGMIYPDCEQGVKHAPVFAEVIVRDPRTLQLADDGQEGLLQFIFPVPHSYPGVSVITDDVGRIVGRDRCGCGRRGTAFVVLGRAPAAEPRGCGDLAPAPAALGPRDAMARHALSQATTERELALDELIQELRRHADAVHALESDQILGLLGELRRVLADPAHPLHQQLRPLGLPFLLRWLAPERLAAQLDLAMHGTRRYLDAFLPSGDRLLHAQPRGLVVHWIAGNVPLLGVFSLVQAWLTKNVSLIKVPADWPGVIPALLDTLSQVTYLAADGRATSGVALARGAAALYVDRDDRAAQETLSLAADARVAWGGREAIEAIQALPKVPGVEDILFGPKYSYMVIGRERLAAGAGVLDLATRAAFDVCLFDQQGCNSPHTIFVERGGAVSPREFAARLAEAMERVCATIPKAPPSPQDVSRLLTLRATYDVRGLAHYSPGPEWTVLYGEDDEGLAEACGGRVAFVRPIADAMDAAELASRRTQSIGVALDHSRRIAFAERATWGGAERCPPVGEMSHYESPWDGVFMMDRLVRWVTTYA